jgi:hypothetical protein
MILSYTNIDGIQKGGLPGAPGPRAIHPQPIHPQPLFAVFSNPLFPTLPGQIINTLESLELNAENAATLSQELYIPDQTETIDTHEETSRVINQAFDIVGSKLIPGYKDGFINIEFNISNLFTPANQFQTVNDQIYPFIKFMFTNDLVLMQRTLKEDVKLTKSVIDFCTKTDNWSYKNNLTIHKNSYFECESVDPFKYYSNVTIKEIYNVHNDKTWLSITKHDIQTGIEDAMTSIIEKNSDMAKKKKKDIDILKNLVGFCTSIVVKIMNRLENDYSIEDTITHECIVHILNQSFVSSLQPCGLIEICADLIYQCLSSIFKPVVISPTISNDVQIIETCKFLKIFITNCETHTNNLQNLSPIQGTGHINVFYHDIICMFDTMYLNPNEIDDYNILDYIINDVLKCNAIIEHLLNDEDEQIVIYNYRQMLIKQFCKMNIGLFNETRQLIIEFHKNDFMTVDKRTSDRVIKILNGIQDKEYNLPTITHDKEHSYPFMLLIQAFLKRKTDLNAILEKIGIHIDQIDKIDEFEDAYLKWEPHLINNQYKIFHKKFIKNEWWSFGFGKCFKPLTEEGLIPLNNLITEANQLLFPESSYYNTNTLKKPIKFQYPLVTLKGDVDKNFIKTMNGINNDIAKRLELVLEAERLYAKPLEVDHININVKIFFKNYLDNLFGRKSGGSPPPSPYLLYILGRSRKIVKKGRSQYVTYKKELIKLSDARKIEKQLAKGKNKNQLKQKLFI